MEDTDEILEIQKERERLQLRQADDDLRWLMGSPSGRRIVWRLLAMARVFGSTFDQHAGVMSFNEGKRSQGLRLLDEIMRLCPHQYPVMAQENQPKPEDTP